MSKAHAYSVVTWSKPTKVFLLSPERAMPLRFLFESVDEIQVVVLLTASAPQATLQLHGLGTR